MRGRKPSHFLLFAEDRQLRLYTTADATPVVFASDAEGLAALGACLAQKGARACAVVSQCSGEEYRLETLPALSGRDRRAVLRRLLARHFPATAWPLAQSLGVAPKGGRPEEKVLLAALASPVLTALMETLAERDVTLAGLYSFALLLGEACASDASGESSGALVLLTPQGQDLQQTCVVRGMTVFSRRVARPEAATEEKSLTETAAILRHYLIGQHALERDAPLWLAAGDGLREWTEEGLRQTSALPALWRKLSSAGAETALAAWLREHRPKSQFAPRALRLARWTRQACRCGAGLGAAVCLAGLLLGLRDWRSAEVLQTRLAAETRAQLAPDPEQLAALHAEVEALRVFFSQYDALRQPAADCLEMAVPSVALSAHSTARLARLFWQCGARHDDAVLTASGAFPDSAALAAFERWLVGWNPAGWAVTLPETPAEAGAEGASSTDFPFQLRFVRLPVKNPVEARP
ncbi:MAG: hypothetical protein LBR88_06385 [Zoogloeaceae bacterium]|nr:hypothetical protein [Zoogloeaceae bacterium]